METAEQAVAADILELAERLSHDWFPEYDGGDNSPSTRELYERLKRWAERTVNGE